jgi:hypothetical protein
MLIKKKLETSFEDFDFFTKKNNQKIEEFRQFEKNHCFPRIYFSFTDKLVEEKYERI